MEHDPLQHRRRSIRLKGYDYAQPGAYFVTIVTHSRQCLLGDIEAGEMRLTDVGQIVAACWQAIPNHFARARLDLFVVMPNHLHGIITIGIDDSAGWGEACAVKAFAQPTTSLADASPLRRDGTQPGSLQAIIQNFKSISTRRINAWRDTPGMAFWQRTYYEHVVRDEADLARLRAYIQHNPAHWTMDQLYPAAPPSGRART